MQTLHHQVLLVEDDLALAELTCEYLQKQGFEVALETNGGLAGRRILREQPDLVILDIMLPGQDGFEICKEIRPQYTGPVMMLTARDEDVDQLLGLESGADDYVCKPVQPRLLLARIHALLRRTYSDYDRVTKVVEIDGLKIDATTREASMNGCSLSLTTAEFDLLWVLASHAGRVLSRDKTLKKVRGIGYNGADRSIDLRISRLRKKLGDDPNQPQLIKTVRGKGYLFCRVSPC